MIPSATDLTYFMEIAHTANVSRAAERLSISQPSLSMAIRRLEKLVFTQSAATRPSVFTAYPAFCPA